MNQEKLYSLMNRDLLERKERRIKRYQDLIVFWSPDDDFPLMACCEVSGQKVRGE